MASIKVQNVIMISACLIVVMATRSRDSTKLDANYDYYTDTDDNTNTILDNYADYYNDILYRDKLFHSLFSREVPVDDYITNRDTADDSLTQQIALGHNSEAFDSLSSNKREDERIDNIQTQQDDASEIPKKFNEPIVKETSTPPRISDGSNQKYANSTDNTLQTQINERPLLRHQHRTNNTNSNHVISVDKRPMATQLQESCVMMTIEKPIDFEEHIRTRDDRRLLLSCTGRVTVNKCEGRCISTVEPTVKNSLGFTMKCSCCKDSSVRTRSVTLYMCTLDGEDTPAHEITRTILEPTSCSCQPCRN